MTTPQLRDDEMLEKILEDERAAAVREFREREEIVIDAAELADV
jgi:hypothetical protein